MQCVEDGRLNLDTPIRTYTTAVPDANATVRQVLAMASDVAAGSTYRYDGDRFAALTAVVEACTGVSCRVALATQILDRIGMPDSVPGHGLEAVSDAASAAFDTATLARYRAVLARIAKPYVVRDRRPVASDYPPKGINTAAGLVSTVRDLARYDAAIDAHVLLSSSTQLIAWTPFRLASGRESPYALGWFVQSTAAGRAVWHYGQWPTFSSLIPKLPDRGLTLILLANSDGLSSRSAGVWRRRRLTVCAGLHPGGSMTSRLTAVWLGALLMMAPSEAAADWIVRPFVGAAVSPSDGFVDLEQTSSDSKLVWGAAAGWRRRALGVEFEVTILPGYFDGPDDLIITAHVTTV
jgi:CubicO group peptidase (beta-lactamase class C family)